MNRDLSVIKKYINRQIENCRGNECLDNVFEIKKSVYRDILIYIDYIENDNQLISLYDAGYGE